jgi:hypothetical protein
LEAGAVSSMIWHQPEFISDDADRFIETLQDPKVWVMALFAAITYVLSKLY